VVEDLRAHGAEVVTVADGFDLSGPAAEVVLAVMAWAAKMERLAINERISAARERLRASGRVWGRPPRPLAMDREKIAQKRSQGLSVELIRAVPQALVRCTNWRSATNSILSPAAFRFCTTRCMSPRRGRRHRALPVLAPTGCGRP
jgi:DNA invertase Pin-like site-specific DNA recombinase